MAEEVPALIDYHCHLDLYPDCEAQYAACSAQAIATLAVTTTPRAWPRNRAMAADSSFVRVGVGIHPQLVGTHEVELSLFEEYLAQTRFVGEVGLDAGPAYYRQYPRQKAVFERILQLCRSSGGKILSVHSIRSAKDVLDAVEKYLAATTNRVVLHWFSGSAAETRRAVQLGCYFSINATMLAKADGMQWIGELPHNRLLTETDGPFTRRGSAPAKPADVAVTGKQLADRLGLGAEACLTLLRSNLKELESSTGL